MTNPKSSQLSDSVAKNHQDHPVQARPRVAYIMSRFPHLPETFILREMSELVRNGWSVSLYPLIIQEQSVMHDEAREWLTRAKRLPFLSLSGVGANLKLFVRNPLRYASTWAKVIRENCSSLKFLVRTLVLLPKSMHMASLMQQEEIQLIHAHYATHPATAAWVIHQMTGISYGITAHAHDIYVQQEMLTTKLRDAAYVAAISEFNRKFMANHAGDWVREKTEIVHCGIVPDNYKPRARTSIDDVFEILTIGSLQLYKGQEYLIEACRLLRERAIPFQCSIIGGGARKQWLENLVIEHGLESCVELLGPLPQEEVARRLPQADCYVQPSVITKEGKMEGIPVSLMEALACSLPVVATDISGISELVQPNKTGFLVPAEDPPAIADAIENIYCHPEKAASLAAAGERLVLEEFELSSNVRKLGEIFMRTCKQPEKYNRG